MRARCGRCGADFSVTGPGRYQCPACGTVNEVRGAPSGGPPPGAAAPPGPSGGAAAPEAASARATCRSCAFTFIVGDVETAVCPMCDAEVRVADDG